LRGECRAISGVTVVTMLVCFVFYRTRGCGRIERPAFPAPSDLGGRMFLAKLAWMRGETAEVCSRLEHRHCEEQSDEAIHFSSFRDGPKDQTRNLEIPGSMLRIAPK
jgi:hypothetical protein